MIEFFLLAQGFDYFHLTPINKVRVEQTIYESKRSMSSDPQISPNDITSILQLQPNCLKPPSSPQIRCEWIEGQRKLTGFWSFDEQTKWKFQRWTAEGEWHR